MGNISEIMGLRFSPAFRRVIFFAKEDRE